MGETFFINVNCSKILESCDESQYTIFIDTGKMSIVYELTEWIRWMFSLDHCFYLMHENSVIHELEDVQFLSKLKNFEIKPCGQPNCVHRKLYRSLLENLNLFVSYNNIKVHKYFLEKLNKMDKSFSQENITENSLSKISEDKNVQNCVKNAAKTDYNKFFFHENIQAESGLDGTPLTKKQVLIDNFVFRPGNGYGPPSKLNCNGNVSQEESVFNYYKDNSTSLNDFNITENGQLTVGAEKRSVMNHSSPIKNDLKVAQATTKTSEKSSFPRSSQKHPRPFSVGELLSNIRGNLEKQNAEDVIKGNNASHNSCPLGNGKKDEIDTEVNFSATENNAFGGRKRPRTRKRKKSKKQNQETEDEVQPFLDAIVKCSLKIPKSKSKPNHIRFNVDDDLMETEDWKCEGSSGNNIGLLNNEGVKDNSMTSTQQSGGTNKLVGTNCDPNQYEEDESGSPLNNTGNNNMEMSTEQVAPTESEAKLIDLNEPPPCENGNHTSNTPESSKNFNQNLEVLLNLKEKFKSAVVIERFY